MSLNWCWREGLGCAIFSSIKVGCFVQVDRLAAYCLYSDSKIVYRRYASLFFIAGCASTDNELITLEIVHRYVEQMDKYYGNVCELDIIFNFQKAYFILDELLLAGEMQESSKKNVLRVISAQDSIEDTEVSEAGSFYSSGWSPSKLSMEEVHHPGKSRRVSSTDMYYHRIRLTRKLRKLCETALYTCTQNMWVAGVAVLALRNYTYCIGLKTVLLISC
jgi:hypothetical protein